MSFLCISCIEVEAWSEVWIGGEINDAYQYCKNNETVVLEPFFYMTTENILQIDSVQYYWDNRYLETKRFMPFVCSYKLEKEAIGSHTAECVIYIEDKIFRSQKLKIVIEE